MSTEEHPGFRFKWAGILYGAVQSLTANIINLPFIFPFGIKEGFATWLGDVTGIKGPALTALISILDFALCALFIFAILNLIMIKWGLKIVALTCTVAGLIVGILAYHFIVSYGAIPSFSVSYMVSTPLIAKDIRRG